MSNGESVRVLLGDDHRLVLDGLAALIGREPDMQLVGEALNGIDLLKLAASAHPDVVVTDLSMPLLNGLEVIHRLHLEHPGIKVICLSMHNETRWVTAALDAGALGYVLKENSASEFIEAIRSVHASRMFLSGELVRDVLTAYRNQTPGQEKAIHPVLSPRERQLVQLFSEGHSTREIADLVCISAKTVATHREHIFRKLGIDCIAELTRYAIQEGISPLEARKSAPSGP